VVIWEFSVQLDFMFFSKGIPTQKKIWLRSKREGGSEKVALNPESSHVSIS
jgi:hypothetical protein